LCRKILFEVAYWTIPAVLNDWLAAARVGYYVPFHSLFEDELPHREDRVKMLNYLAWSSTTVPQGLIDITNGLVYRYSASRIWRLLSVVGVIAAFLVAMAFIAYVARFATGTNGITLGDATIWPAIKVDIQQLPHNAAERANLLIGWVALFVDMLVHVAVATAKRMQSQTSAPPVIAVVSFASLVNAKFGSIMLRLTLALFGFFALVFAIGASKVTLLNFFLAGYTLDSVVELFGATVEKRASAQEAVLRQQLGSTSVAR
jgi:hypothetical protein